MTPNPEEIILDVCRDKDGNLYCVELETSKVVYQTEMLPIENKMWIHQTDQDSPIIAAVDLSYASGGICTIEFHNPETAVRLEYVKHRFPFSHSNTYFTFGDKKYHWKAHSALIEDDTRICLGVHHRTNLGGTAHKLGSMVLTPEGLKLKDMVAVTCLAEQARSDEAKLEKLEEKQKHKG